MWERKLIQTAVKRLLGHGKKLTVPEGKKKTANECNNFPQLIKIKHLFPQLRGGWWAREVLNGRMGQKVTLIKMAHKEAKQEDILEFYCPVLLELGRDSSLPRPSQSVPVAFYASPNPCYISWGSPFYSVILEQSISLSSELKNKSPTTETGSWSSCPGPICEKALVLDTFLLRLSPSRLSGRG